VASGRVLFSDTGLSFWGGIDPATGLVIDRSHPLHGQRVTGAVLAIAGGRGSCTASGVLIEALRTGMAPAAIVLADDDLILALGALVSQEVFGRSLPVVRLATADFERLAGATCATVSGGTVTIGPGVPQSVPSTAGRTVALSAEDEATLAGARGPARALAMRVLLRMAELSGAAAFVDVAQAHLDCCIYTGPSSVALAEHFRDLGGRFAVPTTLNAVSADIRPGASPAATAELTAASRRQVAAYLAMGAAESFTCAPYLLVSCPPPGAHLGWAESNAVMFANSVLGARTQKYPDYLDLCVALTGRAPLSGCHTAAGRRATVELAVEVPPGSDDAFWPLLGYAAGKKVPSAIPVLSGLEALSPTRDDLKAFCAAFATTSGAPMVHLAGLTPEAPAVMAATGGLAVPKLRLDRAALVAAWSDLNGGAGEIDLVALGNPHFSAAEFRALAALVAGRDRRPDVALVVTAARAVLAEAAQAVAALERFGGRVIADTCWCMLGDPVVRPGGRLMTNSAKYAHYGPGLTDVPAAFGSLAACVEAACSGRAPVGLPEWLA
jgi:hypothetical protein